MGRLDEDGVPSGALRFLEGIEEEGAQPNARNFEDASPEIQRLIDPFYVPPARL
jgi:hypothetical protein